MVYKNVEMAGNVIRITKSPNVALLVVFTIVVVVNVFVISVLLTVFPGWIRLALCGFLIVTWCALLLGQKTVTTFNADTRVVTVWNRLKKTRRIPFDEVGAVEFIGHAEACEKGGEVLRLTPPGNRFGRGTIITRNYPEADPELAFFRHVVVPAIAVMLGHEQDVESAEGATDTVRRLPDEPEFFTKHGGIYRRWNLLALVFPSFFAVAFPTLTAIHWHIMLAALGAACLLMALALPCRVELDSDRREVREYKAYGFFCQ
ncbi:MAG: hypothetical protein LIQ31_00670 [Planctomycetes bacterium]|nr:hypothetical protein [Planctomycetota bacterium]